MPSAPLYALALALAASAAVAQQGGIEVLDAYAQSATPTAPTGAAYLVIENTGDAPDRLLSVRTDAAARAQLHESVEAEGVVRMRHAEGGFVLPAGGTLTLARGGRHVMLMGLARPLEPDATLGLTLVFENAGEIPLEVPVELDRGPEAAAGADG